jgi:hypothetical protein
MAYTVSLWIIIPLSLLAEMAWSQQDSTFRYFSAEQAENHVLLRFTVAGGVTCNGIRIERSADNNNYIPLFTFEGVCGSPDTDTYYTFTDSIPLSNRTSWYRLDAGLQGLYSETRAVFFIDYGTSGITVFPNPCQSNCALYVTNPKNELLYFSLFDMNGRSRLSEYSKNTLWNPDTGNLSPGLYFYRISKNNETIHTGKLLVK